MSEDEGVESTFVKNVGFAARSQACSKNISELIQTYGLIYASCAILPSKQKVLSRSYSGAVGVGWSVLGSLPTIFPNAKVVFLKQGGFIYENETS